MMNIIYKFPLLWTNDAILPPSCIMGAGAIIFKLTIIEESKNDVFYITFHNVLVSKCIHHDDVRIEGDNEPTCFQEIGEILDSEWIKKIRPESSLPSFDTKSYRHFCIGFENGPWLSCICNKIFIELEAERTFREQNYYPGYDKPGIIISPGMINYAKQLKYE